MNRLIRQVPVIIKRGTTYKSESHTFLEIPRNHQYDIGYYESITINYKNIPKELTILKNISSELLTIINHDSNNVITYIHTDGYKNNDKYSVYPRNSPW